MIYLFFLNITSRAMFKFILHVSQNVSHSEGLLILVTVYDITSVTNGNKRRKYRANKVRIVWYFYSRLVTVIASF